MLALQVALSGRTLAFEWLGDRVLFRAERQTVARVNTVPVGDRVLLRADGEAVARMIMAPVADPPDDPGEQLSRLRAETPEGDGPIRLQIPRTDPPRIPVQDDAGYAALAMSSGHRAHSDVATV
jgi:hypothetical protein